MNRRIRVFRIGAGETRVLRFRVGGRMPPKKDGAASMWRKPAGIEQLKALRRAAVEAMAGREPWDQPVVLRLRVHVPAPKGEPALWTRREHGDLDNFVTGVCDGLQAADPRAFEDTSWTDVPTDERPHRPIAYTDDSWIRRIEAELVSSESGDLSYEVAVEPLRELRTG